jgi:hypothetical protein
MPSNSKKAAVLKKAGRGGGAVSDRSNKHVRIEGSIGEIYSSEDSAGYRSSQKKENNTSSRIQQAMESKFKERKAVN